MSGFAITSFVSTASFALPLSSGDRIRIDIPEGTEFSGIYEVGLDGDIQIPYLSPLTVAGLEPKQVQENVWNALVKAGLFQPTFLKVSLKVLDWGEVHVLVSGAVFSPGQVLINTRSQGDKSNPPVQISGDYPPPRFLTAAIRTAGGVTPDADIRTIRLIRNGRESIYDLSGIFTGEPVRDIPLIENDQIIVPSTGRYQNELVRPTLITTVGVKIFMSNLTIPAPSNSASGIGSESTSFPYGSRFSQAVVSANCAGGTKATNAHRRALLVRTDRLTGKTWYLERPVEELLRDSNDVNNPYLMSNDALVCYDSTVINIRDVAASVGGVLSPFSLIGNLFKLLF
ncbi:MAG: polysaccharide biosynthesis/export family protein [Thermosynechococcaceae cyanobacterium]